KIMFGRQRLPVLLPLKYYALLLQELETPEPADFSLLDFLAACDLPGMVQLRPFIRRLFQQGRLLLLCDGLDEVPAACRRALDQELVLLLRQNRNVLVLTSTEQAYVQSPELARAAGENLVSRAVMQEMTLTHTREMVERFVMDL